MTNNTLPVDRRLAAHPYAQCYVLETNDYVQFVSYYSEVVLYNKKYETLTLRGVRNYSSTTARQLGWFQNEAERWLPAWCVQAIDEIRHYKQMNNHDVEAIVTVDGNISYAY